jgi:organic radical activating enzyme
MINAACNLSCPFCYGPDPAAESLMSVDDFGILARFLAEVGTEGVVVSGGEPTLRKDLRQRLQDIRAENMWVALQSNGTRRRELDAVLDCLEWLALPMDTVRQETARTLRTSTGHVSSTRRAALSQSVVGAREAGMKLKISTVLTSENVGEVDALAKQVAEIAPDVWKIHQFRPRGEGLLNRQWLEVDSDRFIEAVAPVLSSKFEFPVNASLVSDSVGAYLIINPDSTLLVTQDDHYLSFGRLVVDGSVDQEVFFAAVEYVDSSKHLANSLKAFPETGFSTPTGDGIARATGLRPDPVVHMDRNGS